MTLDKAIENIKVITEKFPEEEVKVIRENKELAIPKLIENVKYFLDNYVTDDYMDAIDAADEYDVVYSFFLLSEFEEKSAFDYLYRFLNLHNEVVDYIFEDVITSSMPAMLANMMQVEDLPKIKAMVEDTKLDYFVRAAAIDSIVVAYIKNIISEVELITYLDDLAERNKDDKDIMNMIAMRSGDIYSPKIASVIKRAFKLKLIDENFITPEECLLEDTDKSKTIPELLEMIDYSPEMGIIDSLKRLSMYNNGIDALNWAVKGNKVNSLREYLSLCGERIITSLCNMYDVSLNENREKTEEEIYNQIINYNNFVTCVDSMDSIDYAFLEKVVNKDRQIEENKIFKYAFGVESGIYAVFYINNKFYFTVTDEVKDLYKKYITSPEAKIKKDSLLIGEYMAAAANLYGAITIDDFVKLFIHYENKFDSDYVKEIVCKLGRKSLSYKIVNDVIEIIFINNQMEAVRAAILNSKPMYIPDKNNFLKYADYDYIELNSTVKKIRSILKQSLDMNNEEVDIFLKKLVRVCQGRGMLYTFEQVCEEYYIGFDDAYDRREFMHICGKLSENVRKWRNKGFTDAEILKMEEKPVKKVIKIGRNEPCPCGSGKKYKQCCGRN